MMKQRWMVVAGVVLLLVLASAAVMTSAQTFGTGWTAAYWNDTNLGNGGAPVYSENLPGGINFDWGTNSPAPSVNADNWSARFVSNQLFNQGVYEFVVSSDDGVRVFIDNVLVLDRFIGRTFTTDRFQQTMTAGVHQLRVEYFDGVDRAALQFQWFQVSTGGTIVPGATLPPVVGPGTPFPTFGPSPTAGPPTATPLPAIPPGALTGTVVRATVLLVRNAPYMGAPVIGRVRRGQTYQVIGRDNDARWFLLQLSGFQGWVWGYYLNVNGNEFSAPVANPFVTEGGPAAGTGVVGQTQAVMRLRAAPDVTSEQIGRVPWGDLVPIIGRTSGGDWVQVIWRDTVGWVATSFIRVVEGDLNSVPVR